MICKLIRLYEQLGYSVLQIEKVVRNEQGRLAQRSLSSMAFRQARHEISLVRYKIAGWLLNWRAMLKFDLEIDAKLARMVNDIPVLIDSMRASEDEVIRAECEEYDSNFSMLHNENITGALDDVFAGMQAADDKCSEGSTSLASNPSDSDSIEDGLSADAVEMLEDGMSEQSGEAGRKRCLSDSVSEGDVCSEFSDATSDESRDAEAFSSDGDDHAGQCMAHKSGSKRKGRHEDMVGSAVRYATRNGCFKRRRPDSTLQNDQDCRPGAMDNALKIQHLSSAEILKTNHMVCMAEQRLAQQLMALEDYAVIREQLKSIDENTLSGEAIAVYPLTPKAASCAQNLLTMQQWPSVRGVGVYVPETVTQLYAFNPGETCLVTNDVAEKSDQHALSQALSPSRSR